MSQIAQMTALFDALPDEAKEALGFMGSLVTLQQEHARLQEENRVLRTNRDQLNENLSRVMERDGELVQEVRDLRGVLSRILLGVNNHNKHELDAIFLVMRSTEWCKACNESHPVLLNDADLYVVCPKTFPHRKAREF
jgi:hypothetical protein